MYDLLRKNKIWWDRMNPSAPCIGVPTLLRGRENGKKLLRRWWTCLTGSRSPCDCRQDISFKIRQHRSNHCFSKRDSSVDLKVAEHFCGQFLRQILKTRCDYLKLALHIKFQAIHAYLHNMNSIRDNDMRRNATGSHARDFASSRSSEKMRLDQRHDMRSPHFTQKKWMCARETG